MNEFVTLGLIQKYLTSGCHVVKFWTLIIGSVSQTLLAFNSSINFLLYPAISKDFRRITKEYLKSKTVCLTKIWPFSLESVPMDTVEAEEEIVSDRCPWTTMQPGSFSSGRIQNLQGDAENQSIILEDFPTQQEIIVSCVNEKADAPISVTSLLVSPSSIRKNDMKYDKVYHLEPPLDNGCVADSELTPFLLQENKASADIHHISVSQDVLLKY